ncbi:hypothetical protein C0Q70_11792 [Pomacea canaliculata]|uniref:EGF-like calcium-binding domain-containing protein n=1 Tax=Pomacea canaliculata TaxID=400727 RepID=A0A2T7P6Z2_POMCA|nr:hypothetical protein C0Q70_11792 [Pomacea canaliculata]
MQDSDCGAWSTECKAMRAGGAQPDGEAGEDGEVGEMGEPLPHKEVEQSRLKDVLRLTNRTKKTLRRGVGVEGPLYIDECTTEGGRYGHHCHKNTVCVNTIGSYQCKCHDGHNRLDAYTCADYDECLEGIHNCHTDAECINAQGSYECRILQLTRATTETFVRSIHQFGCFLVI